MKNKVKISNLVELTLAEQRNINGGILIYVFIAFGAFGYWLESERVEQGVESN